VATMHISGPAARWWQSVESCLSHASWKTFRTHLLDRFGKDEHDLLIRKLFHIKQTGTVAEYISQFTVLVDQLAAYESTADCKYYTMRFIDGLRPEFRSTVLLHRPRDLDTACALASLQDEVGDPPKLKDFKRPAYSPFTTAPVKGPHPLPSPTQFDKNKPAVDSKSQASVQSSSDQDKLTALKAYRRAMGQCYKCGDKWSRGHSCPQAVQLHVVQELWELFQLHTDEAADSSQDSEGELNVAISMAALTGIQTPRTLKFRGHLQSHDILILLDSGSSHTFVGQALAAQLVGSIPVAKSFTVQVADGGHLLCVSEFRACHWSIHSYEFQSDLKILPLQHYDLIVGMDWLE